MSLARTEDPLLKLRNGTIIRTSTAKRWEQERYALEAARKPESRRRTPKGHESGPPTLLGDRVNAKRRARSVRSGVLKAKRLQGDQDEAPNVVLVKKPVQEKQSWGKRAANLFRRTFARRGQNRSAGRD
jgi:hypothetical protein